MEGFRCKVGVAIAVALLGACWPGGAAAAPPATISLSASPTQDSSGSPVVLSGTALAAPLGSTVDVYQSPYPYTATTLLGTATTDAQGAFSFTARPDRNTRYRAIVASTGAAATAQVDVVEQALIKVRAITPGRAMVTVLAFHPADLKWNGVRAHWSFAGPGGAFNLTGITTRTRSLGPHVTVLRVLVALTAGRFHWRVCFAAPASGALLDPGRPPGCSGTGYHGSGRLPVGFPGPSMVARARSYLSGRIGRTAFAVIDTQGRLSGVNVHWSFLTASVVKAMLLVGYLRRLDAMGQRTVDSNSSSFLYPMIHISDNNAATQCWSIVGDSGLYSVARAAGMTDFSVSGSWGTALLSPADQARFFFEMDSLIPREFVGYARFLLSTIDPSQSWGIPVIARPLGYLVFFKDGSEPTGLGQLVHQIGRLEGHHRRFSIAVMTDGDPSMQYGIDTIQGVTQALLG